MKISLEKFCGMQAPIQNFFSRRGGGSPPPEGGGGVTNLRKEGGGGSAPLTLNFNKQKKKEAKEGGVKLWGLTNIFYGTFCLYLLISSFFPTYFLLVKKRPSKTKLHVKSNIGGNCQKEN